LTYRPVVDRFVAPVPLDPAWTAFFAVVFIAAALLTARRPAYGLAALLLSAPIALAHEALGTSLTLQKCVLLGVLAGLTTYSGSLRLLRARPTVLLLGALALYFFADALTLVHAAHYGPAIRETLKVVEYAGLFAAAFLCYRLDADDVPALLAVSVAVIGVSLSALAQEVVGAHSGLYIGSAIVPRISGLLEGPNQLSAYCEVAVAVLGSWALVRRHAIVDSALLLAVCADVLTFSRAGLFGLVVVAATLCAVGGARAWPALRPAAVGAVAGLAGSAWWVIYAHTPAVLRISLQPSLYAGGVGNRGELWSAAWRMWRAHPIFGVGAGNFELELPRYGVFGVRTHANSWYLQSLAEGGIVLLGATLTLVAASIAAFVQRPLLTRLRDGSPWVLAALAASLALALHQVVDYLVFYPKVAAAWWLLLGIGAAAMTERT
jgi:O-antigen ligase